MKRPERLVPAALCGGSSLALGIFVIWALTRSESVRANWLDAAQNAAVAVIRSLWGYIPDSVAETLNRHLPFLIPFAFFAALTAMCWMTLRLMDVGSKASVALAFSIVVLVNVVETLRRLVGIGSADDMFRRSASWLGIVSVLLGISVLEWAFIRFPRILNRETISYIFFGGCTTVVDLVVYFWLRHMLGWYHIICFCAAWVAAVAFAYVTNKLLVFQSRNRGTERTRKEALLFVLSRVSTLAVSLVIQLISVDCFGLPDGVIKLVNTIVVLVLNYILSKRFVFFREPVGHPEERPEYPR